jgi:hypothetical protein
MTDDQWDMNAVASLERVQDKKAADNVRGAAVLPPPRACVPCTHARARAHAHTRPFSHRSCTPRHVRCMLRCMLRAAFTCFTGPPTPSHCRTPLQVLEKNRRMAYKAGWRRLWDGRCGALFERWSKKRAAEDRRLLQAAQVRSALPACSCGPAPAALRVQGACWHAAAALDAAATCPGPCAPPAPQLCP